VIVFLKRNPILYENVVSEEVCQTRDMRIGLEAAKSPVEHGL